MNTLEVEEAWAAAIASVVAPVEAKAGAGVEILPPGVTLALIDCFGCTHRGGGHWICNLRLQINSPALDEDPLPVHRAAWNALTAWLEDSATVHEAFEGTGFTLAGFFVKTSNPRQEDMRAIGETVLVCGMRRGEA